MEDTRGTCRWQCGWERKVEPADIGAQLQERPTGRLRSSSINGNEVRLEVLLRRSCGEAHLHSRPGDGQRYVCGRAH